jgi:hypothetical protein
MTRKVTFLRAYLAQRGFFARVAKRLGFDPSYVSRVANSKRQSKGISLAIEAELNKMHAANQKTAQFSRQKSAAPASKKSRRVAQYTRGKF